MRSVEIRNGRLFYYGSAVGYLEGMASRQTPCSAVRTWKGGWSVKIFRSAGWMECTTGWPTGSPFKTPSPQVPADLAAQARYPHRNKHFKQCYSSPVLLSFLNSE